MLAATKEEILSAIPALDALFPSAAFEDVGENSRLGFARKNAAPHQGSALANSQTALRDRRSLAPNSCRMPLLPQSPGSNLSQKGQVCQEKVQSAVNAALNTSSQFQGPELENNLDASQPGLINGAYNFNYFAPGVNLNSLTNCGRFSSGLHIVMQTPGCNGLNDPNIFNVTPSGSYFTAHIDSASPVDLITALIHFGRDIVAPRLFHYNHGC